jgi:hypothetical protein
MTSGTRRSVTAAEGNQCEVLLGRKRGLGCGLFRCKSGWAKEMRGHGRTSADGLGLNEKKGSFFIFRI